MAVRLLAVTNGDAARPVPDRNDDEESIFHVLIWMTLHYGQHNLTPIRLSGYLNNIFYQSINECGARRLLPSNMKDLTMTREDFWDRISLANRGLKATINDLQDILRYRYLAEDHYAQRIQEASGRKLDKLLKKAESFREDRQNALQELQTRGWLMKTLSEALNRAEENWTLGGQLELNQLGERPTASTSTTKRKGGSQGDEEEYQGSEPAKRLRSSALQSIPEDDAVEET